MIRRPRQYSSEVHRRGSLIVLRIGRDEFDMTVKEARRLADQLHDAIEKGTQ